MAFLLHQDCRNNEADESIIPGFLTSTLCLPLPDTYIFTNHSVAIEIPPTNLLGLQNNFRSIANQEVTLPLFHDYGLGVGSFFPFPLLLFPWTRWPT